MQFSKIYEQGSPALSLEFFPPRDSSLLDNTFKLIRELSRYKPEFMTCTYGAGGGTRALTRQIVSFMHNELNTTAVAHLTCVGHSEGELSSILDKLRNEGVKHVLALRGDPPKGAATFEPHPQGLKNALELVELISRRREFSVAVAGYPEGHKEAVSPEIEMSYLRRKVEAGAEVVFTQLFFDVEVFQRFSDQAAAAGIAVPIVPGIMPISTVNQLQKFEQQFNVTVPSSLRDRVMKLADDETGLIQFGIDYALDMCQRLLRYGVPGIHLYTLNKSTQAAPILRELRTLIKAQS